MNWRTRFICVLSVTYSTQHYTCVVYSIRNTPRRPPQTQRNAYINVCICRERSSNGNLPARVLLVRFVLLVLILPAGDRLLLFIVILPVRRII